MPLHNEWPLLWNTVGYFPHGFLLPTQKFDLTLVSQPTRGFHSRGIRKKKLKLFLRFWEHNIRSSSVLMCLSYHKKAVIKKMSAWCRRCTKTVNSCCVFNKPWNSSSKMVQWNYNVCFHSHILLNSEAIISTPRRDRIHEQKTCQRNWNQSRVKT